MFLLQSILSARDCVDLHTWAIFSYIQYRLYVLCVFPCPRNSVPCCHLFNLLPIGRTDWDFLLGGERFTYTHHSPFLVTASRWLNGNYNLLRRLGEAEPRALVFPTLIWTNGANKTTMGRQYEGLLGGKQNTLMSLLQCLWIWRKSKDLFIPSSSQGPQCLSKRYWHGMSPYPNFL